MIIGVTGFSGAGKSTVAKKIAQYMPYSSHVKVDELFYEALEYEKDAILGLYGSSVVINGRFNKETIVKDKSKKIIIDRLIYPRIARSVLDVISKTPNAIIDWLLLPHIEEAWEQCERKILVLSDEKLRKFRLQKRRGVLIDDEFAGRNSLINFDNYTYTNMIWNNDDLATLEEQILEGIVNSPC